ncbi:MAG TPA: helix-turn-helix transcriptional regulator, partial [Pseudonocardiaceae bacterium]|nr:helix-turn-helix transcriptional regulator [Pseudonocardiaceae bacterium]
PLRSPITTGREGDGVPATARERAPLHRRRLGRQLQKLREQAGLTQRAAAKRLHYSDSKISRFEAGQLPDYHGMCAMLDLYSLTYDQWDAYKEMWEIAAEPGWWAMYKLDNQGYVSMEHEAVSVREFQPCFIPGLLQTEAYTRMFFDKSLVPRSRKAINNQVEVRTRRQERVTGKENPLIFEAIIQECVLSRPEGDKAMYRAQLLRIVERAALPNVTVRVLPEAYGVHGGLVGALTLLSFPDKEDDDVVYLEHALGANHTDNAIEVTAGKLRIDHVRRLALDPAQSMEFVERMAAEL